MKPGSHFIPYGHQIIDKDDIAAVCSALCSDYLTTGPVIDRFEKAICTYTGTRYGVAVSSGTAALHCAMYALDIGRNDEVIVPSMTFVATANCVCFSGATPVLADVESDTLLIDPEKVEALINSKTKAIIGVDYAGQPCDWDRLRHIADKYGLALVADSCHAIGAEYKGRKVGTLADMTVFSFHPVKHITTGEGGMIVTDNKEYAQKMYLFRNHGITRHSEMVGLGYNYRITDIQCALGISQLEKLSEWIKRRQEIALSYDHFFVENKIAEPLKVKQEVQHVYHLYVVRVADKENILLKLKSDGIGVNVHYMPVHLHQFYKQKFGYKKGFCPVAEDAYKNIISLPLWPGMQENDILHIQNCLNNLN